MNRPERDRGSATVTALVLVFAFTAGAVIWLASDVNSRVADRSAAQSVAFQAARAGAQQVIQRVVATRDGVEHPGDLRGFLGRVNAHSPFHGGNNRWSKPSALRSSLSPLASR